MKYLLTFLFLVSCSNKTNENANGITTKNPETQLQQQLTFANKKHPTLEKWLSFYKKQDSTFNESNFLFSQSTITESIPGTIYGTFDKEFDPVYLEFLLYRKDKKQYIDIDSYNWTLDSENKIGFEPDQEINWVDVERKTVKRIAFRGSSDWVEDAYWENDSIIFLLENNYNNYPKITKVNLITGENKQYTYKNSLALISTYTKERLGNKGIKFE